MANTKPRNSLSANARKLSLGIAAAAMVMSVSAPAFAGGGHRGHGASHGHGHGHGHGHNRHRGGGGKGAAIALGVIGGVILLNELSEQRARDRYYDDRYYADRSRAPAYGGSAYYEDQEPYYGDDNYYEDSAYDDQYDDDQYDDQYNGDAYDDELEGAPVAPRNTGPAPIRVSSAAAYQTCLDHARRALGERGFVVSAPYRPDTIEDRGGALLMTATVTAQRGSERWARAMSCEASNARVFRLELI